MFLGELVFSDGDPVYTPSVSRGGNKGLFSFEVSQESGTSPSLVVDIEHKNRDEASWASAGSTTITATGAFSKEIDGLKEEIRLKYTMSGTNTWMRIFTYDPQWVG